MDASYTTNVLPTEILEAIMDQLHTDIRMLGICGLVCMAWLTRSRYHLFSAIRLSPCRARRFFELCRTKFCTFVNCVNYIDVDCAQRSKGKIPSDDTEFPFCGILSLSSSLLTRIKSLSIRHINWTSFSPSDQNQLRQHLASFTELHTLELDNVMFHDLREIVQITSSYPHLSHAVVNVQFSKYMEYAISSAAALTLPSQLETLRLCADEAIPVLLNTTFKGSRISRLILDGVKLWHLPHIGSGLQNLREVLQHLQINFSTAKDHSVTVDDLTRLDLTRHTNIQSLCFSGIGMNHQTVSCTLEQGLPCTISSIQQSHWKMAEINSQMVGPESTVHQTCWCTLHRVILAMLHCRLNLDATVYPSLATPERTKDEGIEIMIYGELKGLEANGGTEIRISDRWIDQRSSQIY